MPKCANIEFCQGVYLDNPGTTATPVAFAVDEEIKFISCYNECDQDVLVTYQDKMAKVSHFMVPKNGRNFTRVLNGVLLPASLKVNAIGGTPGTGRVIFNLGN